LGKEIISYRLIVAWATIPNFIETNTLMAVKAVILVVFKKTNNLD